MIGSAFIPRSRPTVDVHGALSRCSLAALVACGVAVGFACTTASAFPDPPLKVPHAGRAQVPNGMHPTDFHVRVKSDTSMRWSNRSLNQNNRDLGAPAQQDPGPARELNLEWSPIDAQPGDYFEYSFTVTEERYNQVYVETWFTPRASPTDWPDLGWRVDEDGRVTLQNSYPSAIHFSDLLFQFPALFDQATFDGLLTAPAAGTPGALTFGDVPAAIGGVPGELYVGTFDLPPSGWLYARADTSFVDGGFSPITETIAFGHESIPSPGSLLLLSVGGFAMLRRTRSPRPAE